VITRDGVSILPHQNWRGEFSSGTRPDGTRSDCAPGVTTNCHPVAWPGYRTTAWHHDAKEPDIRAWWGGLMDGMRDASGQQYMRNRYYDPATGQFTQPDPIGIAGGLNSYGFAAGDPVSYSDPYGLTADSIYVTGSPRFRRAVIGGLVQLAGAQPWFAGAYNVVAASPRIHIRINEDPTNSVCARRGMMAVNCQYMTSRRTAHIILGSNADATALARGAGHEMIHAFGDLAKNNEAVLFDTACGDPDASSNGCVEYYDDRNRDVLGLPRTNDPEGKEYARENNLPPS
jgi:RHS repeat-associated protein